MDRSEDDEEDARSTDQKSFRRRARYRISPDDYERPSMNEIESLELRISRFLRIGVIISGILIFAGWITQLKLRGNPFYYFNVYDPIPLQDLVQFYVFRKNYGALTIYAGLALLISLPLIRVLLTFVLFLKQKEFALAAIALVVLMGLVLSMGLGIDL
jgi:uncharacterized membrane protein